MQVTFFARVDTDKNPYLLLYKRALEQEGINVAFESQLGLRWLRRNGMRCDAIHIHWIASAYRAAKGSLARRVLIGRYGNITRGTMRLADFTMALLAAKLRGTRIIYTVHNLRPHEENSRFYILLDRLARRLLISAADRIHVHNRYTQKMLATRYGRCENVEVVPIGSYAGWYPNDVQRSVARRRLGLDDHTFVYLFLGLLRPYKGIEELIHAFERVNDPNKRLLIVGQMYRPEYATTLTQLVDGTEAIRIVPEFIPDDELQWYLNACDVFVLPYQNVTTSSAVMLALTFGRPVVAPAITSFPEVVTPVAGVLYDTESPSGLEDGLRKAGRRRWSEEDILDYARRYEWSRLAPQLADLYR